MTVPGTSGTSKNAAGFRSARTALYRFYDADGGLLYVGITKRLRIRWQEHARDYATTWWPKVVTNSVTWFPNREEAEAAEREAIRSENPGFNVLHTPRHRVRIGTRASREAQGVDRGNHLLTVLREHFGERPFTAADAVRAASTSSPSTTEKNLTALTIRGLVLVVGARHVVTPGRPRRSSALYALPIVEWVDGETGNELSPERVPSDLPERSPKRLPVPRQPRREERWASAPVYPAAEEAPTLPPVVTFTSGAALLQEVGLVTSITREGVRFISRSEDWPFGPGKPYAYGKLGKAATMDTEVFLAYFRARAERMGRGSETAAKPQDGGVA
ncbi:GIY-YIG nuclease family protein [Streptomyces hydrogenans]|uniref:GIY-YIG nuclease family protein n=1 Tax=Streptomyces hydrogenans TaxID=1873719 RepID=UPI0036E61A68